MIRISASTIPSIPVNNISIVPNKINPAYYWTETSYVDCLPKVSGIELMELGGMMPTSVTTAVIFDGGVRSYNGLRISRFGDASRVNDDWGITDGNEWNAAVEGATRKDIAIYQLLQNGELPGQKTRGLTNIRTEFVLGEAVQDDALRERIVVADEVIQDTAVQKIKDGDVILTYARY